MVLTSQHHYLVQPKNTGETMSRTQNLRWKRKAVVVAAVAASFAGFAAIGSSTVSASNYGEWDCSDSLEGSSIGDDSCTAPTDYTDDTVPVDTVPVDSVPVDTVPVDSVPVDSVPVDTVPVTDPPAQFPPTPTAAPATPAPAAAAPAQVAAEVVQAPNVLPVTGRGSALPTAFIAIGLLGAGSVALAFARRNSAARNNQS
jgi:hypothetical protein